METSETTGGATPGKMRRTLRRGFGKLRLTTARRRSPSADFGLALVLAFVAGAVNAGGFVVLGIYTSHMTGIVSLVAVNAASGALPIAALGVAALVAFVAGSATSTLTINWARQHHRRYQYADPILIEALLLAIVGAVGIATGPTSGAFIIPILCFTMGLQNATITKISGARMRTTHVTGMLTDIGVEIGRLIYFRSRNGALPPHTVAPDQRKLRLYARLVLSFLFGGICGACGFLVWGIGSAFALAGILLLLAIPQFTTGRPQHQLLLLRKDGL